MTKEKKNSEVGDVIVNSRTGMPQICVEIIYSASGSMRSKWEDYDAHILHTRMGMIPGSDVVHTLEYFVDVLRANKRQKEKEIKIRYAYIASPTNLKGDPAYYETLKFKVLPLEILERKSIYVSIEERISAEEEECIEVLGRDLFLNRVDRDGKEIYERDIVRWFSGKDRIHDEEVDIRTPFSEQNIGSACKVIGTVYGARHVHTL